MAKTPPWEKPKPPGKKKKPLTAEQKAWARDRAKKAGRR